MATSGWMVNLSGSTIPVYQFDNAGRATSVKIGEITKNECFVEGTVPGTGWEGVHYPAVILNANHNMVMGVYKNYYSNLVDFGKYASDGTSWKSVNTLERKVVAATKAYNSDGSFRCDLGVGSRVWLNQKCTRGFNNMSYCAVDKVKTADGSVHTFGNGVGFINLAPGSQWVNVGSILLRKV